MHASCQNSHSMVSPQKRKRSVADVGLEGYGELIRRYVRYVGIMARGVMYWVVSWCPGKTALVRGHERHGCHWK